MSYKPESWHTDEIHDPEAEERLEAALACTERPERVQFVLGEMIACTWAPGDQRRFARLWDLTSGQMHHIVSNAARLYKDVMDVDEMRAAMTAGLGYLIERALDAKVYDFKKGQVIDQPDLKNAIESYRLQAHLNGMLTDKHEISGPGGGPLAAVTADIRRLSPEELDDLILQKAREIESRKLLAGSPPSEDPGSSGDRRSEEEQRGLHGELLDVDGGDGGEGNNADGGA